MFSLYSRHILYTAVLNQFSAELITFLRANSHEMHLRNIFNFSHINYGSILRNHIFFIYHFTQYILYAEHNA